MPTDGTPKPATTVADERARSISSNRFAGHRVLAVGEPAPPRLASTAAFTVSARSHAYLDLARAGAETRPFATKRWRNLLRTELAVATSPPIALGINTDGWRRSSANAGSAAPASRVLLGRAASASIVTKGSAITARPDLLAALASPGLASVFVSVTSLDNALSSTPEGQYCDAGGPTTRLKMIAALREAGVPVGCVAAPVIPMVTDADLGAHPETQRAGRGCASGRPAA